MDMEVLILIIDILHLVVVVAIGVAEITKK